MQSTVNSRRQWRTGSSFLSSSQVACPLSLTGLDRLKSRGILDEEDSQEIAALVKVHVSPAFPLRNFLSS
jgi:hypothetical protein